MTKYSEEIKTIAKVVDEMVAQVRKKFDRALVSRLKYFLIRVSISYVENEAIARKEDSEQIEKILIELGLQVRQEIGIEDIDTGRKGSGSDSWRRF